jgi:hypothetical protein
MDNKFFVKLEGGTPHNPEEKIVFLTHLPRILSKADARELAQILNNLAGLDPELVPEPPTPAEPTELKPEKAKWGKKP